MELDGIIPVYKEKGLTSHDVVARLRRILKMKKIGHTGTLDPSVTGVLPICLGKATKVAEYILDLPKTYEGQLTLGKATTTEDADGEVTETRKVSALSLKDIEEAFACFRGDISQIPPMFSAVKVEGKKLYELARLGKEIERKPRNVTIYSLDILHVNMDTEYPTIDFRVTCSKGTYVRTLCVDIGRKLGYPAHMSSLTRTESGPFHMEQSVTLSEIQEAVESDTVEQYLYNMKMAVSHLPSITVNSSRSQKILHGLSQRATDDVKKHNDGALFAVYSENDRELLAIHYYDEQASETKPVKVFS